MAVCVPTDLYYKRNQKNLLCQRVSDFRAPGVSYSREDLILIHSMAVCHPLCKKEEKPKRIFGVGVSVTFWLCVCQLPSTTREIERISGVGMSETLVSPGVPYSREDLILMHSMAVFHPLCKKENPKRIFGVSVSVTFSPRRAVFARRSNFDTFNDVKREIKRSLLCWRVSDFLSPRRRREVIARRYPSFDSPYDCSTKVPRRAWLCPIT
jgi:hypothetical protein